MAVSKVGICNLALARVGTRSRIASLDEDSVEAQHCKLLYDVALSTTLVEHPWNFATKRVALAELEDPPDDWTYKYGYPADCLKARRIVTAIRTADPPPFEVMLFADDDGNDIRTILTDEADATLAYTKLITDPNLFSPLFVVAMSWGLGAELAVPITGKMEIQRACTTMWLNVIQRAKVADAGEGQAEDTPDADWIEARI